MSIDLPKIYPITDTRISGLSHAEQVRRLIAGGARLVQLREKHLPSGDFYADAKAVVETARGADVRIIVNDRVDLAMALGADGVHLGQDDLPPAAARRLLGAGKIIGFSTHTLKQARAAFDEPIDYIAFGPVFPTASKENPYPVVGLEKLAAVRDAIGNFPLVAIGGITPENIAEVFAAGADSTALISSLVKDPARISEVTSLLTKRSNEYTRGNIMND